MELNPETGIKELKEIGEECLYDKIQESLESTKISNILARYAAGDPEALNRREGIYADITNAPTSIIDAAAKIEGVKDAFEKLPANVKAEFGQDPNVFMAEVLSGTAMAKLEQLGAKMDTTKNEVNEGDKAE